MTQMKENEKEAFWPPFAYNDRILNGYHIYSLISREKVSKAKDNREHTVYVITATCSPSRYGAAKTSIRKA